MDDDTIKIGDMVETRNKKWFSGFLDDEEYDPMVCDKKFKITGIKGMTKFYSGDILLDRKWFKTKIQFQREIEFITKIEYRLEFLANFINTLEGNVLILRPDTETPFLLSMLAAIDFAVIPQIAVDPKDLSIKDYKNTSGPYYVFSDDGKGPVDLLRYNQPR